MKPPLCLISPSSSSSIGVDSSEMEVQRQEEGEKEDTEETGKDRQNVREKRAERNTDSTIHTVPELLLDHEQVVH